MKKCLIIGQVWVEPNSSAAGSRLLTLIQVFQKMTFQVSFASPAMLSPHRFNLAELNIEETQIQLNHASFDAFIQKLNPHIIVFDRFIIEEQFGWRVRQFCPNALCILDTEDLHSLRYCRAQFTKQQLKIKQTNLNDNITDMAFCFDLMQSESITKREIAALYRCDLNLVISQFEMKLLTQYFHIPKNLLHYCPFLLQEKKVKNQSRTDFIWIGNFRHAPNWDAVLWLKQDIWPLIRKQLPSAKLHIYGAYPPKKATALNQPKRGFYIKGWVESADQVMASAKVCLAPLRFGAGLKGKLIEAMQNGTPSVTTAIGIEGLIGEKQDWAGLVENKAINFANAAVQLYQDPLLWKKSQQQGFHILEKNFQADFFEQALIKRIKSHLKHLKVNRKTNFIGKLLHHHQYHSTKYMALWIAEKNKIKTD